MQYDLVKGIIVPIITPIDEEENLDEEKMRKQVDYVIDHGVHGILLFGSNGEFYQMEEDAMEETLKIVIDQTAGRVPVYFGIGAIRTKKCIRLAKMAQKNGAYGISVIQPMFLKPTAEELYLFFSSIAQAVPDLPMLLYNNPGRTGYSIPLAVVDKLAHQVPNIIGMKDSSGNLTFTEECIRVTQDLDFRVFGGKDTLVYASMLVGAVGGVCSTCNFMPDLVLDIYNKVVEKKYPEALQAQFRMNPIRMAQDQASFPVATKDMANLRGMDVGKPFLPNLPTSDEKILKLFRDTMGKEGLL